MLNPPIGFYLFALRCTQAQRYFLSFFIATFIIIIWHFSVYSLYSRKILEITHKIAACQKLQKLLESKKSEVTPKNSCDSIADLLDSLEHYNLSLQKLNQTTEKDGLIKLTTHFEGDFSDINTFLSEFLEKETNLLITSLSLGRSLKNPDKCSAEAFYAFKGEACAIYNN